MTVTSPVFRVSMRSAEPKAGEAVGSTPPGAWGAPPHHDPCPHPPPRQAASQTCRPLCPRPPTPPRCESGPPPLLPQPSSAQSGPGGGGGPEQLSGADKRICATQAQHRLTLATEAYGSSQKSQGQAPKPPQA